MSTSARKHHYTYQDYLGFPDDGQRYEVIFGEKHVNPSPVTKHQRVSRNLMETLLGCQNLGLGEVFAAPIDVLLANDCVVVPDLVFISAERAHLIEEKLINGAPDIVVEILSPSTRRTDQVKKLRLYERYGVREYWIADPEADELSRFVLEDGSGSGDAPEPSLALERVYSGDEELNSPLLTGCSLAVSGVFR